MMDSAGYTNHNYYDLILQPANIDVPQPDDFNSTIGTSGNIEDGGPFIFSNAPIHGDSVGTPTSWGNH
ncbi:hypothetical protein LENED_004687 [Lentinula edodes]|uniref:Uncharacterized protein n=1 Tax=Lentinula edodes TaxID=5353 RepID=A0A1Q3E7I5_LENED|nr:hypothetical protein LENED_004687 [Lentinula edodes]